MQPARAALCVLGSNPVGARSAPLCGARNAVSNRQIAALSAVALIGLVILKRPLCMLIKKLYQLGMTNSLHTVKMTSGLCPESKII